MSAANAVAADGTRRVELGSGGLGAAAIAILVIAAILGPVGGFASLRELGPLWAAGIAVAPLVFYLSILIPVRLLGPGRASVDLTHRVLRTRRRSVPFSDIHRIGLYRVPRSGDWLVLHDGQGRQVGRYGVTWSVRPGWAAVEWRALHELLWHSSAPGLALVQGPSAREAPLRGGLDRASALALVAAHIAWLEQGGSGDADDAPMRRFERGLV